MDRHGESLGTVHLSNIVQTTIFILKMFLFCVGRYFSYCSKIRIGKIAKGNQYLQKANRFWATFFHKVVDVLWHLRDRWGLTRSFSDISPETLQAMVASFRDCAQEIELVRRFLSVCNWFECSVMYRMAVHKHSKRTSLIYTPVCGLKSVHLIGEKK